LCGHRSHLIHRNIHPAFSGSGCYRTCNTLPGVSEQRIFSSIRKNKLPVACFLRGDTHRRWDYHFEHCDSDMEYHRCTNRIGKLYGERMFCTCPNCLSRYSHAPACPGYHRPFKRLRRCFRPGLYHGSRPFQLRLDNIFRCDYRIGRNIQHHHPHLDHCRSSYRLCQLHGYSWVYRRRSHWISGYRKSVAQCAFQLHNTSELFRGGAKYHAVI
jgi:hypothetical protein